MTSASVARTTGVRTGSRLTGLDGVRGLAALVVLIYHGTKIAAPVLDGPPRDVYRALAESPVKLAFAGTEAVLVFFVLSGMVVALPALRRGFKWVPYYASRLLRLYLPVWASLLFAAGLITLIPRDHSAVTPGSWLRNANAATVEVPQLLAEASLWIPSYDIVNVLWSLRWELIFSLALPLFVGIAVLLRRFGRVTVVAAIAAAIAASTAGRLLDVDALVYLPVFLAGTLIASRAEELRAWGSRRSSRFWAGTAATSGVLLIAGWLARPVVPPDSPGGRLLWGLAAAGAVGAVITAAGSPAAERFLSRRLPAWLGRISFALYLVHVPVLATLAFWWGEAAWPLVLAVGFPLSLGAAALFTRLVERPSHRLAQRVRRALARDDGPRPAVPATTAQ